MAGCTVVSTNPAGNASDAPGKHNIPMLAAGIASDNRDVQTASKRSSGEKPMERTERRMSAVTIGVMVPISDTPLMFQTCCECLLVASDLQSLGAEVWSSNLRHAG